MGRQIRLLIVEDSQSDLLLLLREIRRNGYEVIYECVDNDQALADALTQDWDMVISDYSLPQYSAPQALARVKQTGLDLPFIIVSGSVGEENVVSALLSGARDFITKNNFARLIPAIERELKEAEMRRAKRAADQALRDSESRYRLLFDSNPVPLWVYDLQSFKFLAVNDAAVRQYGYSREEFLAMSAEEIRPIEEVPKFHEAAARRIDSGLSETCLKRHRKKDGSVIDVEITSHDIEFETHQARLVLANDITQRKRDEERLQRYNQRLRILHNIDRSILTEQVPESTCSLALDYIVSQIPVSGASIVVFDFESQMGAICAAYSASGNQWPCGKRFSLTDFMPKSIEMLHQGKSIQIDNLSLVRALPPGLRALRMGGLSGYLAIPLIAQNKLIGSVNLGTDKPPRFTSEQLEMVQEIADQLAIAIQQHRFAEQIRQHTAELENRVIRRTAELQQTTDRVEAILNNSSDAILLTSFDGVIQQINPAFNELFGYKGQEIIGESLLALASVDNVVSLLETLASVIRTGKPARIEMLSSKKDGTRLTTEVALAVIVRESTIHGVVCGIRDISERIAMEQNLRDALQKEKELNDLKSRFTSMVSHEFRTPLTVIRSSTWLIQRYSERMTNEKRDDHLQQIQVQIGRLTDLLDDVLTLSRAESVTLQVRAEPLDFQGFCTGIVDEIQQTTQKHTIRLDTKGEIRELFLDPKLMRQMIANLLTNAVKYSPEGGVVSIGLTYDEYHLIVRVQDQGIGIPEIDQAHLFEVFHRAKNVGNISGTGLGLPIVKRAVEAHGGEISVESSVGSGTTFTIRIPIESSKSIKDT